jgi:succinyl-diaminopimelate desuccinylase
MTNRQLLKKLMAVPSPSDDRAATHRLLDAVLAEFDTSFTIESFERNGVRSALVYVGRRPEQFRALLTIHLDVIPATRDELYQMRQRGTRAYGAGILDMKAGAAVAINVFRDVATKTAAPIALQVTTDEETGGFDGALYQVEQGVRADFVLATEPTNLEIVHKAKGILQCEITARGVTAHGAYPWRGDNALWRLHDFLSELQREFPNPDKDVWQTTINLGSITTPNMAFNKIPDMATAKLDIRFVAGDDPLRRLRDLLPEQTSLEVIAETPVMNSLETGKNILLLANITGKAMGKAAVFRGANGTSDARHFAAVGSTSIEFGPVGGDIGGDNEWVDMQSLGIYEKILRKFLLNMS